MLTTLPARYDDATVAVSVSGIRDTVNRVPSTEATVRLIPSTAIEPRGTTSLARVAGSSIVTSAPSPPGSPLGFGVA